MGKWTITDIPGQSGRTAVITGANSDVGFAIASALRSRELRGRRPALPAPASTR